MVLHLLAGTPRKMLRYLIRPQGHRGHSKPTIQVERPPMKQDDWIKAGVSMGTKRRGK